MTVANQIGNMSTWDLAIADELGRSPEDYWFATQVPRDLLFAASLLGWRPGFRGAYAFRAALTGYPIRSMPMAEFLSSSEPPAVPVITSDRTGRPLAVNLPALLLVAPQLMRGGIGPRKPLPVG